MSYHNISPLLLQQLHSLHELTLVLSDLAKFSITGRKAALQLLNLHVKLRKLQDVSKRVEEMTKKENPKANNR